MTVTAVRSCRQLHFDTLPSFSQQQAAAWNVARRLFAAGAGWRAWISDGLSEFLESPAGFEIRLRQKHTMDSQKPDSLLTFDVGELMLGRDETCDVRLAPRSIGKRHARIFAREGRCYVEDLGSQIGTFLNEKRLNPNRPAPIATGDEIAVFPYTFSVELSERWVRDAKVEVHAGPVLSFDWRAFRESAATDRLHLILEVHPIPVTLLLEAGRPFLEGLSARLLAPLVPGVAARLGLTSADTGFIELLITAVLERMNREIQFPLQAVLPRNGTAQPFCDSASGLSFSFSIRLADLTGTFRLFLPDDAVEALSRSVSPQPPAAQAPVSWFFLLSAGYVELSRAEIETVEPSDVVLLTRETAILFPGAPERGWRLLQGSDNLSQASIDNYFERGSLIGSESEREVVTDAGAAPNFADLPIRMHAIIGEKEMTLAEANLLIVGSIVELDEMKTDPVRIALNGKIVGHGELVEVDGRLGVRIIAWRAP